MKYINRRRKKHKEKKIHMYQNTNNTNTEIQIAGIQKWNFKIYKNILKKKINK